MIKIIAQLYRFRLKAALFCVVFLSLSGAAKAQSCQSDMAKFGEQRNQQIAAINAIGKANHGKLDPVAACPRFRILAATEMKMLAYLKKNKDWCNIPDDLIKNFTEGSANTQKTAGKACQVAAQIQQQQRNGGLSASSLPPPPKLPAGPL